MPQTDAYANPEQALIDDIGDLSFNPLGFVKYIYDWRAGDLVDSPGPRKWQRTILEAISSHLKDRSERHSVLRVAVASGHGIGKSALVSMIIDWAMSTCEDCRVLVTANTGGQLASKTVPEVHKWFNRSLNRDWWDMKATSITVKDERRRQFWRTDFETWSENNTEAFQGLHNERKRIVLIFDEASAISDKIWEVSEGALTDKNTELIWLVFGNPTQNTGRFRRCFGDLKHRWKTFQIDSRSVEDTTKEQQEQWKQWAEDYGEDSDFVRVRVRGEFPRAGSSQFIPSDVVSNCRRYKAIGFESLPKVLSVDVARFGDDQTVIGCRQGRKAQILGKYRGKDNVWVAEQVIRFIESEEPDAWIIDEDGTGTGVYDQIKHRGYTKRLFGFHGGATPNDANAYYNRRAEVWGLMREWLIAGAEIPDDAELEQDLTGPEYGFSSKNQLQLEKKEDMKKRGLSSPDCGDMLAMTFAVKVAAPKKKEEPKLMYPGQFSTSWME